jgi:arsenite methyltransferase
MASRQNEPAAIRDEVRAYYGARARSAGSSCCGPSNSDGCCGAQAEQIPLYSAEELVLAPEEAATASLGCGNPTVLASLRPGDVAVDLGSGGGLDVLLAARQVGPTGFVYGVDMTDDMLDLARRNAAKAGVTNVEFRKGHIEQLPLPDASVDVILSNCVINLSPEKERTLREAFRVLRPGGRLAVSDIAIDGDLSDLPVAEEQVRTALSWAGCIAGAPSLDEYRRLLADAGFEDVRITIRHRLTLADVGQGWESAGKELPADVVAELASRFVSSEITARRPETGAPAVTG